jgi:hypothetical protein
LEYFLIELDTYDVTHRGMRASPEISRFDRDVLAIDEVQFAHIRENTVAVGG